MKLSIAAGILSAHSVLNVVSEAKLSTWLNSERRSSNGRHFWQEKITMAAVIGSTDLVQQEKKDSTTLVNSQNSAMWWRSQDKAVECTPDESAEAHIGVLGCAVNQICIWNVDSGMGGFCLNIPPLTSARSLQIETLTDLCDPASAFYQDCDCSDFDITTASGSILCDLYSGCLGSVFYGCYNACFTMINKTSLENGESISFEACYNFSVDRRCYQLCLPMCHVSQ